MNQAAPSSPSGLSGDALERQALGKQERLLTALSGLDSLLVAFSGGADSAYLAWAAHTALGHRALAVTAISPSFSSHDREQAAAFVRQIGLGHQFIQTNEFENPLYVANQADRCYHCKNELFAEMETLAAERGFAAIAYGINADDTHDFRPGHRAAAEHQVLAPLLDAGLAKAEVRLLSRRAGLPTWDRPASACLSSRVAYGIAVTPETLSRIERGEEELRRLGFRQFRLRDHGRLARIEIAAEEMPRALRPDMVQQLVEALKPLGYDFVTLDLEGYRQGSLNRVLRNPRAG
ncbi:MAG TPA: ATP-dependent sacrificial sulfur transferase LarE [Candidatus Dormibacteraeota bacterium]|nr:ATP-dependent sacrificial sulfur transferase LarE [Candidatus Dormibacteraeota bacterium]